MSVHTGGDTSRACPPEIASIPAGSKSIGLLTGTDYAFPDQVTKRSMLLTHIAGKMEDGAWHGMLAPNSHGTRIIARNGLSYFLGYLATSSQPPYETLDRDLRHRLTDHVSR
ncbi:hypothetical protein RJZ57_002310 [Blastomyces gilchristii]